MPQTKTIDEILKSVQKWHHPTAKDDDIMNTTQAKQEIAEWIRAKREPDIVESMEGVTLTFTGMTAEELEQALLADLEEYKK